MQIRSTSVWEGKVVKMILHNLSNLFDRPPLQARAPGRFGF